MQLQPRNKIVCLDSRNIQIGSFDVTFRVSDGSLSDTESVWITVIAVNHPPVLTPIGNKAVGIGNLLNFTVNATDPDDSNLTFSSSSMPFNATFNSTTSSFAWIPNATQIGTYNVKFGVTDGSLIDTETINITVLLVNHPPVLAPIGNKTVSSGTLLNFTINATDPDDSNPNFATGLLALIPDSLQEILHLPDDDVTATNLDRIVSCIQLPIYLPTQPSTPPPDCSPGHRLLLRLVTYNVTFGVSDGSLSDIQTSISWSLRLKVVKYLLDCNK